MVNLNLLKTKILIHLAKKSKKISHISKFYYTKLRHIYHKQIPASFYLLFENDEQHAALNCLLFTKVLYGSYRLCIAKSKVLGRHIFIDCEYEIIDPTLGIIIDKEYYYSLLGINNPCYLSMQDAEDTIDKYNIGNDTIYDCRNIDYNLLASYKQKAEIYGPKKRKYINDQIDSFIEEAYEFNNRYIKIK